MACPEWAVDLICKAIFNPAFMQAGGVSTAIGGPGGPFHQTVYGGVFALTKVDS